MEDLSKKINEEGQKVQEHIEAAVEDEKVDKDEALENLEYADGKERDEIDEIEAQEMLRGADKISPFGTNDTRVFKRKLEKMTAVQKANMASRTATRVFADEDQQNEALIKAFHEWRATNWGSTGGRTEEKSKVLASDSLKDFEKKLKGKTLSELQEMAMKLGFTPSFDRIRLISALRQEYLKRG
tara:strand:- start:623 stop:1177 length:555 start_codon:yes stop_codon:yes gene_type:complete